MKSLTIHGIDDELDHLLQRKAQSEKASLNKTIKRLLAESLGINKKAKPGHRKDFEDLFGAWSQKDLKEFTHVVKAFEKIDKEDWA